MRQWAFNFYDDPRAIKLPHDLIGRGAEHEVYGDPKRMRVVKVTRKSEPASYGFGISLNNDGQGATAGEYLDRLCLHNAIFNDDLRLEGVVPSVGATKIVISQPFIKGAEGEEIQTWQIDAYMHEKGLDRINEGAYYHPGTRILVHDLFPRNIVLTTTGRVRAIDPAIMRATPELARHIATLQLGS